MIHGISKTGGCMERRADHHEDSGNSRIGRWAFWGFALVAGYFLLTEHRAHLFNFLPYLLLAACPLMHFFHHGGHGHHHASTQDPNAPGRSRPDPDKDISRNLDKY
jgi:hypothetical protein